MKLSFPAIKQTQPLVNFRGDLLNLDHFMPWRRKDKVVVVMGATGTGKSRLSIDLATRFLAEIVNSDKMQVYDGLDIVTNKVTEEECRGVPHHLLGVVDSNDDFTATDFRHHATTVVESIVQEGHLPIIAGGSNSFIKSLVNDEFILRYDCCFLWIDVSLSVLDSFVSDRVDKMVESGLVDEVRQFFDPNNSDYTRGLKRAIGVPEMDEYFRVENCVDKKTKARLLKLAIENIKCNTRKLARYQLQNILRLQNQMGWHMHHLDATEAFIRGGAKSDEAWERYVARPSATIVDNFLNQKDFVAAPSSIIKVPESVIGVSNSATTTGVVTAIR